MSTKVYMRVSYELVLSQLLWTKCPVVSLLKLVHFCFGCMLQMSSTCTPDPANSSLVSYYHLKLLHSQARSRILICFPQHGSHFNTECLVYLSSSHSAVVKHPCGVDNYYIHGKVKLGKYFMQLQLHNSLTAGAGESQHCVTGQFSTAGHF